jgi:hypothetical protein
MLFPITSDTPSCEVFKLLNSELLHFLDPKSRSLVFSEQLFLNCKKSICWSNKPTRLKFETVWIELQKLTKKAHCSIYRDIKTSQSLENFFSDKALPLPAIAPVLLLNSLKSLTTHLFTRTKDLSDTERAAGQSLLEHFLAFEEKNSNLCPACGTELLAQGRSGTPKGKQWRAAYDHLLCKDKYPEFAIHPANLLPTCHTCNSKAKGAKNVIIDKAGNRRLAFYPYIEHCSALMRVELSDQKPDSILELIVKWEAPTTIAEEKLSVWKEIYQVPERVEHELSSFPTWLHIDCQATSLAEFTEQIKRRSQQSAAHRHTPWLFWKTLLYKWIDAQDNSTKESLWAVIVQKKSSAEAKYSSIFGI